MKSSPVVSTQTSIHQNLSAVVTKHLHAPFKKPIVSHNQKAFDDIACNIDPKAQPLIFDSFCGTGESTCAIAQKFPLALVIGIDKSAHRLSKAPLLPNNALLVRADTDDFWRIALEQGWQLQKHFILYPNPWPKPDHLKRRIHGSALWPTLLQLGGELTLRSNWKTYIDETHHALSISHFTSHVQSLEYQPEPLTAFERKYQQSDHLLWQLTCQL